MARKSKGMKVWAAAHLRGTVVKIRTLDFQATSPRGVLIPQPEGLVLGDGGTVVEYLSKHPSFDLIEVEVDEAAALGLTEAEEVEADEEEIDSDVEEEETEEVKSDEAEEEIEEEAEEEADEEGAEEVAENSDFDPDDLEEMPWKDLQALAKSKGISLYQQNRDELIEALLDLDPED